MAAGASSPPRCVLLADDDDDIRELLRVCLERGGFEVIEFADGSSLLDEARRAPGQFQLVVSDIGMPGPDGVEVARQLHSLWPDLPVVLITAFRDEEIFRRAREAGAADVMTKPLDLPRLVSLASGLAARA